LFDLFLCCGCPNDSSFNKEVPLLCGGRRKMKIIRGFEEIDWVLFGLPMILVSIVLFNILGLMGFFETFLFFGSISLVFIWYGMQDRETIFKDANALKSEVEE
jgi:hypothetical protein